ncbi:MAG: FecR domain-containing protein [Lacunisphaera sp.]
MKSKLSFIFVTALLTAVIVGNANGQQNLPPGNKAPTSKIYFSEAQGESSIISRGVTYTAQQAKSFEAPGTVIETKEKARDAFVYSNGTGIVMEQNSRLQVGHFTQERFQSNSPTRTNPEIEPSISHSEVRLTQGAIGICTNQLAAGTTMVYSTPLAEVRIRHGRLSIEASADETIVDLLEGDVTVSIGAQPNQAQVLHPGDRATIHAAKDGQPATLIITQTPQASAQVLDERTTVACNAKKTVFFDANDAADQEITPNPTVPAQLPNNITVSPDRLTGTP